MVSPKGYFDAGKSAEVPGSGAQPAGRPGPKKRETSRRIFRAAIELMRERDFDSVSVEEICEAAGVARATFFKHFPAKAAIYRYAIGVAQGRIETDIDACEGSAREKLALVVSHLEHFSSALGPASAQMFTAFIAQPGGGFRIDDPETGIKAIVQRIVREGQAHGEFSTSWSPQEVAVSLVSAWVGASRVRLTHGSSDSTSPFESVLQLLLQGLAKD